jgi:predicted DCC family thiol-disulfide oxidoreductase YuxK
MAINAHRRAIVIYDGQCPFCLSYVSLLRLRRAIGEVSLVDARGYGDLVVSLREQGINLDDGMVLILDGKVFHGADCMNQIAIAGLPKGFFAGVHAWLFRSSFIANRIYPLMKFCRRLTLLALGRQSIEADLRARDKQIR